MSDAENYLSILNQFTVEELATAPHKWNKM